MQPRIVVQELDHVVLRCRDQARALDFYTRVLGLTEERRLDFIGLVQLRAGRSLIDLVPADAPPSRSDHNMDHFCVAIERTDLYALAKGLAAEGVEILGDPMPRYGAQGTGLSLYVRDPEGNVVELKCPPEPDDG